MILKQMLQLTEGIIFRKLKNARPFYKKVSFYSFELVKNLFTKCSRVYQIQISTIYCLNDSIFQ
jgi:hypothetical protein